MRPKPSEQREPSAHRERSERREPFVQRIVRYPVKGLPGVPVEGPVAVVPGRGLRWDRSHAIEHGLVPERARTGWNPRESYFHLAKHERIAAFGTALADGEGDHPTLTVTAPDGRAASLDLGGARDHLGRPETAEHDARDVDALLGAVLPPGPAGAPALVRTAAAGLWDWPAAHLSIINLATLEALGEAAGAPVDPRRFRGNLYLGGLPAWGELALLGRRIRIGDAVLEVFQPTDRCRATTINPLDAVSDLNVPALLASRFGHMFCGVYARVVTPGSFAAGDPIEPVAVDAQGPGVGAVPMDAEPGWPRTARVLARHDESASVTSLWLSDPLGFLPTAKPGQHVRVHVPGATAPSWRCYTISAAQSDGAEGTGLLRISVKRDGRISSELHDAFEVGRELVVTGPFGEVTIDPDASDDVLFVSAGAGITPTVAMLRALAARAEASGLSGRRVRVLHVDRTAAGLPLWNEVRDAVAVLGDAEASVYLSRETPSAAAALGATAGRPTPDAVAATLAELDAGRTDVYVCGPAGFTAEVRAAAEAAGVDATRVHAEVFFSPTAAELTEPRPPSTTGPHRIAFGEDELVWTPESGSVLDAVEGIGVDWPSGCRVGACGTCARSLRSGTVEYLTEPLVPPPAGSVLVCCTAPTTDVVFDPAT